MEPSHPDALPLEKVDAWVIAIRNLARASACAHTLAFSAATSACRMRGPIKLSYIQTSHKHCVAAGIPEPELTAIYTLIFG